MDRVASVLACGWVEILLEASRAEADFASDC